MCLFFLTVQLRPHYFKKKVVNIWGFNHQSLTSPLNKLPSKFMFNYERTSLGCWLFHIEMTLILDGIGNTDRLDPEIE